VRIRCIDCRGWATHSGRCHVHHKAYESARSVQSHSKRREAIARGDNAAARMRKVVRAAIRTVGFVECATCRGHFLGSQVDVDHVKPLALGGEDIDGNVQVLCKRCHKTKTRADFPSKTPPF
jgi:5-methylcytosine-specific restriction protein A